VTWKTFKDFAAHLLRKLYIKFRQNRPDFLKDITEDMLVFFCAQCIRSSAIAETARVRVITPFKVIQDHLFWYQLKALCDFLLVNAYILSGTVCKISRGIDQSITFYRECLSITNLSSETFANIVTSYILLKTRFCDMGLSSTSVT